VPERSPARYRERLCDGMPGSLTETSFNLTVIWGQARERACVKQEFLSCEMGYTHVERLTDAIAGRSHLSLQRLMRLTNTPDGRMFLYYFAMELGAATDMDLRTLIAVAKVRRLIGQLMDRQQKRVPVKAEMRDKQNKEIA
jgi:hypothetical protein